MPEATETDDGGEQGGRADDFWEALRLEGVTIDGSFYCTTGTGRSTRYHEYDPGLVKGFDAIREDGEIVGQEVANHDEALVEDLRKSDLEGAEEKFHDGFGTRGPAVVESTGDDGSGGDEADHDPLDADELMETIYNNFEERGFFAENDDGDTRVVSLAHPDARLMGYITGSHVGSLPTEHLSTVDDYRQAVFQALVGDAAAPEDAITDSLASPDDVPVAPDEIREKFKEGANSMDEETRERISRNVKRRWEDGEYDHLRKDDEEVEESGDE